MWHLYATPLVLVVSVLVVASRAALWSTVGLSTIAALLFANLGLEGRAELSLRTSGLSFIRLAGLIALGALPTAGASSQGWVAGALLALGAATETEALARRTRPAGSASPSPFPRRVGAEVARFAPVAVTAWLARVGLIDVRWILAPTVAYILPALYLASPHPPDPAVFSSPVAYTVHGLGALALPVAALAPTRTAAWIAAASVACAVAGEVLECVYRLATGTSRSGNALGRGAIRGLLASLVVYYGIPGRLARLRRLYVEYVKPGELVIDVGAHVGNRVRVFRSLGARVVAVEPQRVFAVFLARLYHVDNRVEVLECALGSQSGAADLHVSSRNPTMSSLSNSWTRVVANSFPEQGTVWDRRERVRVETLDSVIARVGAPAFLKIDVEGFEHEVLAGLSTPISAVSFEFFPAARARAIACLRLLEALGNYRYNYAVGESSRLALARWTDVATIRSILESMAPQDRSGDVYARLTQETAASRIRI